MQRYFTTQLHIEKRVAHLREDSFHHIKNVMRNRVSDKIIVCDLFGHCFESVITSFQEKDVTVELTQEVENSELPVTVDLAQGLIRRERYEYVLQKATELGVNKIIPVHSKYSIIKLEIKKQKQKQARWNKITKEASEQSHRNTCVTVTPVKNSFKEIDYTVYDLVLVANEKVHKSKELPNVLNKETKKILLIVGPEGGLHKEEISFFETLPNSRFVGLGKRILRSETASSYLLSVIGYTYELGDLS